jgi:flagellar assembly protein FliH
MLAVARAEANRERALAKDAAVVLARKMAEKIVGHAVAVDPKLMREIAARALDAAKPGRESVLLRVHPDDLACLEQTRAEWLAAMGVQADVKLVADATVGRSGCIVETAVGRLDARLQTQLDALERALRGAGIVRA